MNDAFAGVTEEEGVLVRAADVDGMTLAELRFPPDYVQEEVVPELPYLALVIDGGLEKSFRLRTMHLTKACALTMPADVAHAARFGPKGARIVIVKPKNALKRLGGSFDRLVQLRVPGMTWLAWRLAGELRAVDTAAPLAAAGLALELLAATSRANGLARRSRRPPAWLRSAEELLRACPGDCIGLGELADAVGVHPTHLARAFRSHHGVSVGEYGRRVRLEWAAAEIARGDAPLAMIAAQAGFADQSHFTRLFKHHVGTTPARYRSMLQTF